MCSSGPCAWLTFVLNLEVAEKARVTRKAVCMRALGLLRIYTARNHARSGSTAPILPRFSGVEPRSGLPDAYVLLVCSFKVARQWRSDVTDSVSIRGVRRTCWAAVPGPEEQSNHGEVRARQVHAASLQLCAKDHGWHGSIFAQRNRNLREASFPQYTFIGAWFLGEGQCRCQGFEPIPTVPACHGHFMHFHACCHVSHTHGREFTHVGRCRLLLLISGEAGVLQRSSEPDRLEENDD